MQQPPCETRDSQQATRSDSNAEDGLGFARFPLVRAKLREASVERSRSRTRACPHIEPGFGVKEVGARQPKSFVREWSRDMRRQCRGDDVQSAARQGGPGGRDGPPVYTDHRTQTGIGELPTEPRVPNRDNGVSRAVWR